jgi:hypothetical protein
MPPSSAFAFGRIFVSTSKIVTVGASVALGEKDKPARAAKSSDYHKQLECLSISQGQVLEDMNMCLSYAYEIFNRY